MCGKKSKSFLKMLLSGFVLMVVLSGALPLYSDSSSAENSPLTEILSILQSYEQTTNDLWKNQKQYVENYLSLSENVNLISGQQKVLEQNSKVQDGILTDTKNSLAIVQRTLDSSQIQIDGLESLLKSTQRELKVLKTVNNVLIGISVTSIALATALLIFN